MEALGGEVVLITGANTGLGYEVAKILYKDSTPRNIVITSRSIERGNEAIQSLKALGEYNSGTHISAFELDVSNPTSVSEFVQKFTKEFGRLDALVNNAAITLDRNYPSFDDTSSNALQKRAELFQQTLQTNVIGPEVLTCALLPFLLKSANPRLIFVSSELGSLAMHADPADVYAKVDAHTYRSSKSALNMLMINWHKRLKDKGVKVYGVCPGFNATNLGGPGSAEAAAKRGAKDPAIGGGVIADIVLGKRAGEEGFVVAGEGKVHPW